jgi:acylphosphatase
MDQQEKTRLHAVIDGHVQGVGFRMFVSDHAKNMGLTGWVRNTYAGQVEVTAEGSRSDLEAFLSRLRQGPRSAFVTDAQVQWQEATGEFSRFDVRRTI